ncbi:MAG: hypothetical protein KF819_08785 [Labilithrix sp.]|nr:hypothetical protein [Labilithrix sp.]
MGRLWLPACAAIGALVACSDGLSYPAPYQGLFYSGAANPNAPRNPQDEGGIPRNDAGSDGSAACGDNTQLGQEIRRILVDGAAPALDGGALAPGTYVLSEYVTYTGETDAGGEDAGPDPLAGAARFTLTVSGNTYTFVGSRGAAGALPADTVTSASFTTAGNVLTELSVCPVPGVNATYAYDSDGDTIVIVFAGVHEIYKRR